MKTMLICFLGLHLGVLALLADSYVVPSPAPGTAPLARWERWVQVPAGVPVTFSVTAIAANGSTFNVALKGITAEGEGTGDYTNTPVRTVYLAPNTAYRLTVSGPAIYTYELTATAAPVVSLLRPDEPRANFPTRYEVYLAGVRTETESWTSATGDYEEVDHAYTIVLRKRGQVRGQLADRAGDPRFAPGNGTTPTIGPFKDSDPRMTDIRWSASLGHVEDGNRAGFLKLLVTNLTQETFTPLALLAAPDSTVAASRLTILTNSDGGLLQVQAPQALVNVLTNQDSTEARFYYWTSVEGTNDLTQYFTITNGADQYFVLWRIRNPDQGSGGTNHLQIIEERNHTTNAADITYTPSAQTWALTLGSGTTQRLETRRIAIDANGDRLETNEVRNASSNLVYKVVERYHQFSWGWELKQATVDPQGAGLVTTYEYYETGSTNVIGKLKSITYPDGYWEKREYETLDGPPDYEGPAGALRFVLHPWMDSPTTPDQATLSNCQRTAYYYDASDPVVPNWNLQALGDVLDWPKGQLTWSGLAWLRAENFVNRAVDGEDPLEELEESVDTFIDPFSPLGTYAVGRTGAGAFGQADHVVFRGSAVYGTAQYYYYHWGTNDTSAGTFTPSADGSDWRMSVIYGNDYGAGDLLTHAEGVQFVGPPLAGRYFYAVLYQSYKETTIVSQGAVRQKEKWVYTGLGEGGEPGFSRFERLMHYVDTAGHVTNVTRIDESTQVARVIYTADWRGTNDFVGDLKWSETDEAGIQTSYTYDSMKRVSTVTKVASTNLVTSYEYDPLGSKLREITSAGSLSLTNAWMFDVSGRLVAETNTVGLVTTYTYGSGGRVVTKTLPNLATEVTSHFLDRRTASITGTAVLSEYNAYELFQPPEGTTTEGIQLWVTTSQGATNSARWTRKGMDAADRETWRQQPSFSGNDPYESWQSYGVSGGSTYNDKLTLRQSTGLPATRYSYDALGRESARGLDLDASPGLDAQGIDRFTTTSTAFALTNGDWFMVTSNLIYLTNSSATPTVQSVRWERLTGLATNVQSEVTETDLLGNTNTVTVSINRDAKTTTTVRKEAVSTLAATNIVINGLLVSESTTTVPQPTQYTYDALERQIAVRSPLGFYSGTAYSPYTGQVLAATNLAGQVTGYAYYPNGHANAGLLYCETAPNLKKTYHDYDLRGQPIHTWGDVPYPEERVYDPSYGDLIQLKTYRAGASWASATNWPGAAETADVTTWTYQPSTGLLLSKADAAGQTVTNSFDTAHRLATRSWARTIPGGSRLTTTTVYNDAGDLEQLVYNDGTTSVFYGDYDRRGSAWTVTDASGLHALAYDLAGRLASDRWTNNGVGFALTNSFDLVVGRTNLALLTNGVAVFQHRFAYDAYGRLLCVSNVATGLAATYAYLPNADLVQNATSKNGSSTVLAATKAYQFGYRLTNIANVVGTSTISAHAYTYDSADRRTKATLADGSYWNYGYDDRDEVTSARRYWADNTAVAGQQFAYGFDNIGNRAWVATGGDQWGANLRYANYSANNLDQVTLRTVPGFLDVVGTATNNATVTVNNYPSVRKGEYFRSEPTVSNDSAAVWQTFNTLAVQRGGSGDIGRNETNYAVLPPRQQSFVYDPDGNLARDGCWSYEWDGENRLKAVTLTNVAGIPNASRQRLEFTYDRAGRRVTKTISVWNGSVFTNGVTTRFVCDPGAGAGSEGWDLVAELNSQNLAIRSHLWGLDVSGTMDGAGGIGGLLMVTDHSSPIARHFVGYDGNGNVTALINAADNSTSALYEYGPFGELIRATGPLARANPFRFSTKFWDEETALVYYGYRYYSPSLGRWISRDPIGEKGGRNLYGFIANNAVNGWDPLGDEFSLSGMLSSVGNIARVAAGMAMRVWAVYDKVQTVADGFNAVQTAFDSLRDGLDEDDVEVAIQAAGDFLKERAQRRLFAGGLAVVGAVAGKALGAARSGLEYIGKGRLKFGGLEVRAVRDLSHVSTSTLVVRQK
jgi:RHS repeat-associated protein